MMRDNLDPNHSGSVDPAKGERAEVRDESAAAPTDREVPIEAAPTPAIIHAWLDGEPVDQAALHAAGGYELWARLQAEANRRRRMQTPSPVTGAIMKAIRKED